MPANDIVRFKDLPDLRNLLKSNVAGQTILSPLTISGTAPTINFDDTTGGDDNYSLSADADIFRIQNTDNNATVLRLVDGAGEDFDFNVDSDILSIINPTGPITYIRFRGGANDDIQVDRPITFNSTVSGLTFTDITLSDATPTITFTDITGGHDDYSIAVEGDIMTFLNIDTGASAILNQRGFFRLVPVYIVLDGTNIGNVTTGLDPLNSFSIDPGMLVTAGDKMKIFIAGTFGANNNDKRIVLVLDGNTIDDTGLFDQDGGSWDYDITLIRLSATSIRYIVGSRWGIVQADGAASVTGSNGKFFTNTNTVTVSNMDSNSLVFEVQAEGTASDDIRQRWLEAYAVQII